MKALPAPASPMEAHPLQLRSGDHLRRSREAAVAARGATAAFVLSGRQLSAA